MAQFNGKVAIVTGSTQGLGKAVARLLAERGAAGIVICGRNKARGEATAKEITAAYGTKTIFVPTEQSKIEDCKNIISTADKIFGRIDTLINCAAITNRGTILNTTPELFDAMFDTNVRGPFFLIQETLKVMIREKNEGTIVNIGSMSAKAGQPFLTAYCSSKGALATLTENIAFSVLRNRIRVNGLNIGWMASEGEHLIQQSDGNPPDWLEKAATQQPFGRLIDPNEVARAVAFLASSESGLMTGANVNYDQSVWGAYEGSPHPSKAMTL
jgi:NAD(P)-dependent dehydrogenase (short-subunit alcohol dehydrogenase family)